LAKTFLSRAINVNILRMSSTTLPPRTPKHPTKPFQSLGPVLLTLFIDLVGLSIVFPLSPAILNYYLPKALAEGDWLLLPLIQMLQGWATAIGNGTDRNWLVSVLFGGIIGSCYGALQFIFAPLWGQLSDRIGRKPVLSITLAGTACSYLVWVFAKQFEYYVLARVLAGIMAGNLAVANAAVADLTSRENRTKGMALVGIVFGLGFILGPALGGLLSKVDLSTLSALPFHGALTPFSAAALASFSLAFINFCWLLKAFPETLRPEASQAPKPKLFKAYFAIHKPLIRTILKINFCFTLILSGMEFTFVFLAVERFQYSPSQNGLLLVYVGFILMLTQGIIARKGAQYMGEKRTLLSGFVIGILAYSCLGLAYTPLSLYLALSFLGLAIGLISPVLSSLLSLHTDASSQGQYMGVFRGIGALARVFGPILGASLYFYLGSQLCYALGALAFVYPLLLAFALPKKTT
jgi:MFS family permease